MREAYRKNKNTLYEHLDRENIQLVFIVILRGNTVPDYLTIEKHIKVVIDKLIGTESEDRRRKTEVAFTSVFGLPTSELASNMLKLF